MTVASTSKLAYEKKRKKIGPEQMVVYKALKQLGEATDLMLSDYLGKEISSITARRHELMEYGYVKENGRRYNRTGNSAKAWVTTNPNFERIKRIINGEKAEVVDCY